MDMRPILRVILFMVGRLLEAVKTFFRAAAEAAVATFFILVLGLCLVVLTFVAVPRTVIYCTWI
jgi:hypothetical protein